MLDQRISIEEPQVTAKESSGNTSIKGLERFRSLQKIGEGTYGVVYKAFDTVANQTVAIKKVKLESDDKEGIPQTALREISILRSLENHPNIVNLNDVIYKMEELQLYLIFEYVDYDLKKYLEVIRDLSSHQVKLLNGLLFCHQRRIIHRDLKPQNVLVDKLGNIKIADFGLAKTFSVPTKTLTHEVETLWYRAPEILLGVNTYSLGVDMWSLGCIFHELVEKKPMFASDSEIDAIFKIFQFHGTPNQDTFPGLVDYKYFKTNFPRFKPTDPTTVFKNFKGDALDLLLQMITLNPAERISVKEALLHPYFDSLTQQEKDRYNLSSSQLELNFFSV